MVRVPGGHLRSREIRSFALDSTEVTVSQYTECVQASACKRWLATASETAKELCNFGVPGREQHPMNCVSWDDAVAYCEWAGKRLPSEVEWEYAATAAGVGLDGYARPGPACWQRSSPGTCPVASFPPAKLGFYDLAGNVWEWIGTPRLEPTPSSLIPEPRTALGGSWQYTHDVLPGEDRWAEHTAWSIGTDRRRGANNIGFRCARN